MFLPSRYVVYIRSVCLRVEVRQPDAIKGVLVKEMLGAQWIHCMERPGQTASTNAKRTVGVQGEKGNWPKAASGSELTSREGILNSETRNKLKAVSTSR
jgi:hypothetical protein